MLSVGCSSSSTSSASAVAAARWSPRSRSLGPTESAKGDVVLMRSTTQAGDSNSVTRSAAGAAPGATGRGRRPPRAAPQPRSVSSRLGPSPRPRRSPWNTRRLRLGAGASTASGAGSSDDGRASVSPSVGGDSLDRRGRLVAGHLPSLPYAAVRPRVRGGVRSSRATRRIREISRAGSRKMSVLHEGGSSRAVRAARGAADHGLWCSAERLYRGPSVSIARRARPRWYGSSTAMSMRWRALP